MDHQPFKLVRPLSTQLFHVFCKLLKHPRERLGLVQVDAAYTLAANDHVDHREVLALLSQKLSGHTLSAHPPPLVVEEEGEEGARRQGRERGRGSARAPLAGLPFPVGAETSRDGRGSAPVPNLQTVHALHRAVRAFPAAYAREVADLERRSVTILRETLSPSELSSAQMAQLWAVATKLAHWREVMSLADAFPLSSAGCFCGDDEFTEVLSAVLSCTLGSVAEGETAADGAARVHHREALLRDVMGETVAWRRCVECLEAVSQAPTERQAVLLPLRASNLVMLGPILGHTGREPGTSLSKDQWRSLTSPQGPSSLNGVTLQGWLQRAAALSHPATPSYLRDLCESAMIADLWRIYAEHADVEGTLLFRWFRLPVLLKQEPLLNALDDSREGFSSAVVRAYHTAMMRHYIGPLLEKGSASASSTSPTTTAAAATVLPLMRRPEVLVNLLLSFSFAEQSTASRSAPGKDVAAAEEEEEQYAEVLMAFLVDAMRHTVAQLLNTIKAHDPYYTVDDVVCCWPLMDTACLLAALEGLFYARADTPTETVAPLTAFGRNRGERRELMEQLLSLVKEAGLLSAELLEVHGTARVVATLLLHAPNTAKQLGVFDVCLRLLSEHTGDGFSRRQLLQLQGREGSLGLSSALVEKLNATAEALPVRL